MSYVDSNLTTGEQVAYRAAVHWAVFFTLRALLTLFIAPVIERATSEFAVTNRRVIIKVGLISRRTLELKLEEIESIGVDQRFLTIANPLGFRKAVNEAAEAYARESRGA